VYIPYCKSRSYFEGICLWISIEIGDFGRSVFKVSSKISISPREPTDFELFPKIVRNLSDMGSVVSSTSHWQRFFQMLYGQIWAKPKQINRTWGASEYFGLCQIEGEFCIFLSFCFQNFTTEIPKFWVVNSKNKNSEFPSIIIILPLEIKKFTTQNRFFENVTTKT